LEQEWADLKIFLKVLILLTLFATITPHENTAVLCFSHDGDLSIRESDHSLCKDSHEEMSSISLEKDSHDHCNDVVIPSFTAKTQAFKFAEPLVVDSGLNLTLTFFH
jgi:hypothetical protein